MSKHNPRYRYDCERCKFNWNCGILCACVLQRTHYSEPPNKRSMEVAKAQREWRERRQVADKLEWMAVWLSKLANNEAPTGGLPRELLKRAEDMIAPLDLLANDIHKFRHPEEEIGDDG